MSHGSSDTIPTIRGCVHFENTRRHCTQILKNRPTKTSTLHYGILCIFKNKCSGEPLQYPTVPATPFPQCEVAPTSRTPTDTEHMILKKPPTKMSTLHYVIRRIFENECARVSPYGVPRFQRHHSHNVRLCPLREHPPTRSTYF